MRLDAEDLMENSKVKVNKPKKHNNTILIGILIAIIITIIIILAIVLLIKDMQPKDISIKIYVDGKETQINNSIFLIEDNKLYVSVKGIANIAGYEVHSGEYKIEAQDENKVFVENKQETASMFLNSTTISKIEPNTNEEYKNYTMSEPARNVNGDIYVISDGIQKACNLKVQYNSSNNTINIQTLQYLYEQYNKAVQNLGFIGISDEFENKKALLYDRIIIQNSDGRYGVIDSHTTEIIGTRYAYIQFNEYNQEFIITNSYNKIGVDYIDGETKINVNYDEIKGIQKEKGLYLVKNNNKYGIIDSNEKIIVHLEYDDIGVDISPYTVQKIITNTTSGNSNTTQKNPVKQYIFFNTLIPVKQNNLWGFFNTDGDKLSDVKYTDIGCKAKLEKKEDSKNNNINNNNEITTATKTTGNLLLIEEYELVVIEQNGQYGLIDTSAKELFKPEAEDMYSITNAGIKSYYMIYHGNTYDLETSIFKGLGLIKKTQE